MDIHFEVGKVMDLAANAEELMYQHWLELGKDKELVPLDIDWEGYQKAENAGLTFITLAYDGDKLIGYCGFLLTPAGHYVSSPHATNDLIYLDPMYRTVGIGAEFMRFTEAYLKVKGIKRVLWHVKPGTKIIEILGNFGYDKLEEIYGKTLGD